MKKHIVCLSFDFDALSIWISRGMMTPLPISRGEFGAIGARRILALLDRFGIKATLVRSRPYRRDLPRRRAGDTSRRSRDRQPRLDPSVAAGDVSRSGARRIAARQRNAETPHREISSGIPVAGVGCEREHHRPAAGKRISLCEQRHGQRLFTLPGPGRRCHHHVRAAKFGRATPLDDAPHFEVVRTPNWIQPGLSNAGLVAAAPRVRCWSTGIKRGGQKKFCCAKLAGIRPGNAHPCVKRTATTIPGRLSTAGRFRGKLGLCVWVPSMFPVVPAENTNSVLVTRMRLPGDHRIVHALGRALPIKRRFGRVVI